MAKDKLRFETLALHGGTYRADPVSGAVAVPIYQTTSYQFQDTGHASRLFALEELGNIYTRVQNPTWDALETRITALEGGAAALAVASGQAASAYSVLNLAQAGDNIVSSTDLYGGTWTLFAQSLRQFGIEARFVDPSDPEAFRRATDAKTRAYYAEILPNPKLHVFPIREVADIGRSLGVPLIADNTATPLIARPFEHGAAVVVYSATKYIGGHGTSIGGLIIDGGNFPWEQHAERFPLLTQPDDAYHGAIWTEAAKPLGPIAYALRARVKLLRDIGAALSPFNAFQLLQGLETLPLRLRQHNENAIVVANFLKGRSDVSHVIFPGLQTGEPRRRADAYLKGGYGGLIGFELKGGVEAGRKFIDSLELLYHVANIGDARSLAIHPASTTHQQLTPDEQLAAGVTPGYVRLSIGLEHPDDILEDLSQALDAAGRVSVHEPSRKAA
jgi:O-acetylhomoserine (thiol)-lyase